MLYVAYHSHDHDDDPDARLTRLRRHLDALVPAPASSAEDGLLPMDELVWMLDPPSGKLNDLLGRLDAACLAADDEHTGRVLFVELHAADLLGDVLQALASLPNKFFPVGKGLLAGEEYRDQLGKFCLNAPRKVRQVVELIALFEYLQRRAEGPSLPHQAEGPSPPPRYAVILLVPPDTPPAVLPSWDLHVLAVEDADRFDRPMVREVLRALGPNTTSNAPRPVEGLGGVPESVRDMAPSRWGTLAVGNMVLGQVYLALKVHPRSGRPAEASLLTVDEFRHPPVRRAFEELRDKMYLGSLTGVTLSQGEKELLDRAHRNTLHVFQVCRQLSTYTLEGNPFICNVLITRQGQAGSELHGPAEWDAVGCELYLKPATSTTFTFSNELVRAYAELAQNEQAVMVVDADTCRLTELRVVRCRSREHTRRHLLCGLAQRHEGLVLHVTGSGTVEVYDGDDFRLWYDGFRWRQQPYEQLTRCLKAFYTGAEQMAGNVRRVIGAVMNLIDRRASSILVFTTNPGRDALVNDRHITHVHAGRPADLQPLNIKAALPLSALVGLLRVDGAHILLDGGTVAGVSYRITPKSASGGSGFEASGTGTTAARELSELFYGPYREQPAGAKGLHRGFVVKVSADRNIHIFWRGARGLAAGSTPRATDGG